MILNFLKNYGKVKAETMSNGIVNLAAEIDSEGVAEAAIKQKQDEHNLIVQQLIDAQNDYAREKKEFDDIYALYQKKLAAAERAKADMEKDAANTEAATAFNELILSVEKLVPALDKEKREFEEAERYMKEVQEASDDIAKELMSLREVVTKTQKDIKESEIVADRERKKREKAEVLAGLRSSGNKFDVALKALQDKADKAKNEANVNATIATQLQKPNELTSDAANKYLDEGVNLLSSDESMEDKLARLKAK